MSDRHSGFIDERSAGCRLAAGAGGSGAEWRRRCRGRSHPARIGRRARIRRMDREPDATAPLVGRVEPGVIARLVECKSQWCRVEAGDVTGWMRRMDVWGVYPDESVP